MNLYAVWKRARAINGAGIVIVRDESQGIYATFDEDAKIVVEKVPPKTVSWLPDVVDECSAQCVFRLEDIGKVGLWVLLANRISIHPYDLNSFGVMPK